MRCVVPAFSIALILALCSARPATASGDDEAAKLKARIEKLEAENQVLKQQVAKLTEQLAIRKKVPTGPEIVIEIDNEDDITIGEKKHTLLSLRKLLAESPPREVGVRKKESTSGSLQKDLEALLKKNGYTKDSKLGNEQVWVPMELPSKQP